MTSGDVAESRDNRGPTWFLTGGSPLILALVVFLLALGPRVLDLAVFVGPDEFSWVDRSANFTRALASGDLAQTYQTGHPGVTLMWVEALGTWVSHGVQGVRGSADWDALINPEKTIAVLGSRRQVVAVMNAILVALASLMAARVFGMGAGWLTGFLLAFNPFLLTESRALRTEGVLTGFSTLALLSLLLYVKERRVGYSALAGGLTGLALLSKVSAVILLPLGVVVIAGTLLLAPNRPRQERWRGILLALAAWGGALLFVVVALWPALWVAPADVLRNMSDYVLFRAVEGGGGGKSFFLGRPYPNEDPGPLFYPVVLLYRTGPLLWLGLAALAVVGWVAGGRSPRTKAIVGVTVLYLALYLALITRSDLKYDRYVMPMLPGLSLMAALGLVIGWQWVARHVPRPARWGWIMALLVLAGQMALALPHHPYYYTYWNPLLGGLRQAVHVLPVGTGGEGIDQVVDYLNAFPDADAMALASANSQKIKPIFKGDTISMTNVDGRWFLGDYTFIYISQLQRGKHDPDIIHYLERKPPEFLLTLRGLDYGWLYEGPAAHFYGGDTKLEGRGTLHAYDLSATELSAGQNLTTTLYFRNEGQLPSDRFYVRLVDADGYVWADDGVGPRPGSKDAFRTRGAIVEGQAVLALPVGMIPDSYHLHMGYEQADDGALIGTFDLPSENDTVTVSLPVHFPPPDQYESPSETVADELGLMTFDVRPALFSSGGDIWLTLYWWALADIRHDYVLVVRLLDANGAEVIYRMGRPARSVVPTDQWRAGQEVQDPWLLALPDSQPGDTYRLELALFDADSQEEIARFSPGEVMIP